MKLSRMVMFLVLLTLTLLSVGQAFAEEQRSVWREANQIAPIPDEGTFNVEGDRANYSGRIRVYVAETTSRWKDQTGLPFNHAMLSFAVDQDIFLLEGDSLYWDVIWNGNNYTDYNNQSYGNITESNIEVTAAVTRSDWYTGYSDPPHGAPFEIHLADASATATPGNPGENVAVGSYTHSVFILDGSTTW